MAYESDTTEKEMTDVKNIVEKIIDGCKEVKKNPDIHKDAKTLATLVIKDCNDALKKEWVKEWVGLTDGDVNYCVDAIYRGFDMKPKNEIEIEYFERVIKFVEAKLKEKNDR